MTALRDAALDYARRGWPVFPLAPKSKIPDKAAEHGFKDASTDPDQIAEWWGRNPKCNIGLRTGVAFDVLDFDDPTGLDALDAAEPAEPGDPEQVITGPMVFTSRGLHIYVAPSGLNCRTGLVPNVDYKAISGYVVAAPSVHPSGHVYEWDSEYHSNTPLKPIPEWLAGMVGRRQIEPSGGMPVKPLDARRGDGTAYGWKALDSELDTVASAAPGTRNHQLNASAYKLFRLVAGEQLTESIVVETLIVAAARCGLGATEAERTIASARSGLQNPKRPT